MDCVGGKCIYQIKYANPALTKGVLSNETFTFLSDNGAPEPKKGVVFGCSNYNKNFTNFRGEIDGILGMSYAPLSLTAQIRNEIKRRFSCCFVQSGIYPPHKTSFLRFGDDFVIKSPGGNVQTTPFVRYIDKTMYALNLTDISIGNNSRIGFPPGTFALKPDGSGGCLIDSGAAISYIQTEPYQRFRQAIMQYFEQYHLRIILAEQYHLDLCYQLPGNFNKFPSITFHFQRADLKVVPGNAFLINYQEQYFCLAMKPKKGRSRIGAMQQQNIRFVYDIGRRELSFVPEDCSQDAE
ncbi:Peptidase A1 [Macleaya cordata]|nr:Peptidase A1 [Macleaya cordata]